VRLFLDTSVLLAARGSARGASRKVFRLAPNHGWLLIATPYVVEEVLRNLGHLPVAASADWVRLRQDLVVLDDLLTLVSRHLYGPLRSGSTGGTSPSGTSLAGATLSIGKTAKAAQVYQR